MSEYKRCTERIDGELWLKNNTRQGVVNAIESLAELEDKIEQGTLIFKENEDENSRKE